MKKVLKLTVIVFVIVLSANMFSSCVTEGNALRPMTLDEAVEGMIEVIGDAIEDARWEREHKNDIPYYERIAQYDDVDTF